MISAYILEQEASRADMTHKGREWLQEAEDSCSRLRGVLGSWQKTKVFLATFGAPVGALILAFFVDTKDKGNLISVTLNGMLSAWRAGGSLYTGGSNVSRNHIALVFALMYFTYLLFPLVSSFRYNRDLFFPDVGPQELPDWRLRRAEKLWEQYGWRLRQGTNIYKLEDDLFDLVGVAKRREPRIDAWVMIFVSSLFPLLLILSAMPLLGSFGLYEISVVRNGTIVLIILFSLGFASLIVGMMRHRQFR
jgi:hypothetical protein